MRMLTLRDGRKIPVVGQGTWELGVHASRRDSEVAALQLGLDLGMTLIDTAEMYADGGAEEVVGQAIEGRRDQVFLVSKVMPENASRAGTILACERSLKRLRTDRIDLYLLHWESTHPLAETVAAFTELERAGKIGSFGVSNFDGTLLPTALAAAKAAGSKQGIACNQVLYNLAHRGIEWRLHSDCVRRGILVMAYSPLDQGRLKGPNGLHPALAAVAARQGASPAQVALAWTIRVQGVVTIPKAATPEHLHANAAAAELRLDPRDLAELDAGFPPPDAATPLETN